MYNKYMQGLVIKRKLILEMIEQGSFVLAQIHNFEYQGDIYLVSNEDNLIYSKGKLVKVEQIPFSQYMEIKKIEEKYFSLYNKEKPYYAYYLEDIYEITPKRKVTRDSNKDFLFVEIDPSLLKDTFLEIRMF